MSAVFVFLVFIFPMLKYMFNIFNCNVRLQYVLCFTFGHMTSRRRQYAHNRQLQKLIQTMELLCQIKRTQLFKKHNKCTIFQKWLH